MTARAEIDLNVRTRTGTFTGIEDITGKYEVGDVIHVVEPESGLWGSGVVTAIDHDTRLVYISLAWRTLSPPLVATAPAWADLRLPCHCSDIHGQSCRACRESP